MPSPTLYDQYILPPISCPPQVGKAIEIRINPRGDTRLDQFGPDFYGVTGSTLGSYLITSRQMVTNGTQFTFDDQISDTDGVQLSEEQTFTLDERFSITGDLTVAGPSTSTVTENFKPDGIGFCDFLFNNAASVRIMPCFISLVHHDLSREVIFSGFIDVTANLAAHGPVSKEHTSTEIKHQQVTVKVQSWTLLGKTKTIADAKALFDDTTFSNYLSDINGFSGAEPGNWFGGYITEPGKQDILIADLNLSAADARQEISTYIEGATWDVGFDIAAYGRYNSTASLRANEANWTNGFPQGCYGIRIGMILQLFCDTCGYLFDPTVDFVPAFEFTRGLWHDPADASHGYVDDVVDPFYIEACFNYLFGVNPSLFSSPFVPLSDASMILDNPLAFGETTTITSALASLCWQFGCLVWPEIDQSTGYVRLRLLPRNQQGNTMPTDWRMRPGSKEDVQQISKAAVEVNCKGDSTTIRCPAVNTGDVIKIELPFATRSWGDSANAHPFTTEHVLYDYKTKLSEQWKFFKRADDSQTSGVSADGWVPSRYLYFGQPSDSNTSYPSVVTNPAPIGGSPTGSWSGFYQLRSCTDKPGVYDRRQNTLYAAAQFYARELIGNRRIITRSYIGCVDSSTGNFRDIKLGMTATWKVDNAITTFRAIAIKRELLSNTAEVKWMQAADYTTLDDLSFKYLDPNGGTTSGGGSGGTTTSNTDYNTYLVGGIGISKIGVTDTGSTSSLYPFSGITFKSSDGTVTITNGTPLTEGTPVKDWANIDIVDTDGQGLVVSHHDTTLPPGITATPIALAITVDDYCSLPFLGTIHIPTSTPFKFQPLIMGYYDCRALVAASTPIAFTGGIVDLAFRFNGATFWSIGRIDLAAAATLFSLNGTRKILFNGSTDYIEVMWTAPTGVYNTGAINVEFQASRIANANPQCTPP